MMTNLFSIFDPATSNSLSLNWVSMGLCLFIMPLKYFFYSPYIISNLKVDYLKDLSEEFKPMIKKHAFIFTLLASYMTIILVNNCLGLLPYVFTSTSHMCFVVSFALPIWLGMMMYGVFNNSYNMLIHLIPTGTPFILMPFMVLIESVSNIIRPLTLVVRLSANMIAGHLLVSLLSSALAGSNLFLGPFVFAGLSALSLLEFAVCWIQAYVFSVLIGLYSAEACN